MSLSLVAVRCKVTINNEHPTLGDVSDSRFVTSTVHSTTGTV